MLYRSNAVKVDLAFTLALAGASLGGCTGEVMETYSGEESSAIDPGAVGKIEANVSGLHWKEVFNNSAYTDVFGVEPCGSGTWSGCGCADGVSLRKTSTSPRAGGKAAVSILENCHERAEFREKDRPDVGDDRYYGFSLKPHWSFDTQDWTIVQQFAQWYSGIPGWADTDGGWAKMTIKNGHWYFTIKYSDGSPQNIKTKQWLLGYAHTDRWTDFVINAKWRADSGGKLQVWLRDPNMSSYDKRVYREGSIMIDIPKAPYLKLGNYRGDPGWGSNGDEQKLYIDEVRVGTSFHAVDI